MRIDALTVSVNYADRLAKTIVRWLPGLDSLTVVTDLGDNQTRNVANAHGCRLVQTDLFYRDGATFNKARAMEHARQSMPWSDWVLFFDPDIMPQEGWRDVVESHHPHPGNLYGARRYECMNDQDVDRDDLPVIHTDGIGVGYFQLFHTSDTNVQETPLLETCWKHAGIYDCHFMHKWTDKQRKLLPVRLVHIGERDNWWGRGNKQAFAQMMDERRRHGGYEHERITIET